MQELVSLVELLSMLVLDPRSATLLALLAIAAVSDYRSYRIPNWLTFGGAAFALLYSAYVPFVPGLGFLWALGGLALGLVLLLPAYAFRVMGAGDVKLMAMCGAFLGVDHIIPAVLLSFIVGGAAAIGTALYRRALVRMASNVKDIGKIVMMSAATGVLPGGALKGIASVGKLPYGVCIAAGTAGYLVARQLGYL
ncbi:MAG TPA: A24 family peptidase [Noviherbaspirillum sp.]|uniref:A24 family peptidase n=1 Tax=Noviherbaspirillum sp. TaxID=1926288 RepID=UPI002D5DFB40|nr:A24 family peptidase [Noviherbaspirillum sp.]HYD95492.1 A24 family peptidase [Noviherbaspirillum sp.]